VRYTRLNNQNIKQISFNENERQTSAYFFDAAGKIQRRFASYHGPKRSKYVCENKAFDTRNATQATFNYQSSFEVENAVDAFDEFDNRNNESGSEKDNAILILSDSFGGNENIKPAEMFISFERKINSIGNDMALSIKNKDSIIENDFNEELVNSFEERKVFEGL